MYRRVKLFVYLILVVFCCKLEVSFKIFYWLDFVFKFFCVFRIICNGYNYGVLFMIFCVWIDGREGFLEYVFYDVIYVGVVVLLILVVFID